MANGVIMHDWAAELEPLMPFATGRQVEYANALVEHGSLSKAAKAVGVNKTSIQKSLANWRRRANAHKIEGVDVHTTVPNEHYLKGASVFSKVNDDGSLSPTRVWTKSDADKEALLEALMERMDTFAADYGGLAKPIKQYKKPNSEELINVILIGDMHMGLYCWMEEVGVNWDTDLARDYLIRAITQLVHQSPNATECLLVNLGDFLHSDNDDNRTKRAGHALDVDSRWSRVMDMALDSIAISTEICLKHHDKVTVINALGNHDDSSSVFLSKWMKAFFKNEPRIDIQQGADFNFHQFGSNLFGVTHGHTIRKPEKMLDVMIHDRREVISECRNLKVFVGHYHHQTAHEFTNGIVEYYGTLAPADAWAHAAGYRSIRQMRCETYRKNGTQLCSNMYTVIPEDE